MPATPAAISTDGNGTGDTPSVTVDVGVAAPGAAQVAVSGVQAPGVRLERFAVHPGVSAQPAKPAGAPGSVTHLSGATVAIPRGEVRFGVPSGAEGTIGGATSSGVIAVEILRP